jgi:hypothetical protein
MTVVACASLKHSPGATTLAVALAQAFHDRETPTVVLDADPFGGDVAAYTGLPSEPGLVTLAAACRHPDAQLDLAPHLSSLPNGGSLVASSGIASQAAALLAALGTRLAATASIWPGAVIVDCGRLSAESPAMPLVVDADHLLLVVTPSVAGVLHVQDERDRLLALGPAVSLLIAGDGPYRSDEIETTTGLPVLATVPHDRRGATGVMGSLLARTARRTPLGRTASSLVDLLATETTERVADSGSDTLSAAR